MKSKRSVRRWACLAMAALTLFGASAILPFGTAGGPAGEPQAPPFSCALRVAGDGGLYRTAVDFPVPSMPADAARAGAGRGP